MSLTKQRVDLIELEENDEAEEDNTRNSNGCDEDDNTHGNLDLIEVMSDSTDDSLDDDYDKFDIEDEVANDVHEQMMDVH